MEGEERSSSLCGLVFVFALSALFCFAREKEIESLLRGNYKEACNKGCVGDVCCVMLVHRGFSTDGEVSGAGLVFPSNVTLLKETLEGRRSKMDEFYCGDNFLAEKFSYPISVFFFLSNRNRIRRPDTTQHIPASLAAKSSSMTREVSAEAAGGLLGKSEFLI